MKFKAGDKLQVCDCQGIDSGKIVTVIPLFDWQKAMDGTYKPPSSGYVPVLIQGNIKGFKHNSTLSRI